MTQVTVWEGWVGGIAIGIYAVAQVLVSGKLLGVSTGYGNLCSFTSRLPYFNNGNHSTANNWRLWFLIGLPLGGLLASLTSPSSLVFSFSLGEIYNRMLPNSLWLKGLLLTLGGILIGYGARLAGGCTSGHTITGVSLLNWPSLLASAGFFLGGIVMVQVMFQLIN